MKNHFLEMLMDFFEKSLDKMAEKKEHLIDSNSPIQHVNMLLPDMGDANASMDLPTCFVRPAKQTSMRILIDIEKHRMTKSCYQFLTRLQLDGVVPSESLEAVMHQLLISESPYITLDEAKWNLRQVLSTSVESDELAFLDFVLFQEDSELELH